MIKEKRFWILVLTIIFILTMTVTVLASSGGVNPGIKLGDWIRENVKGLLLGIVAILAIIILVKRSLMTGIIMLVFIGIAFALVYGGEEIGQKLGALVRSWL